MLPTQKNGSPLNCPTDLDVQRGLEGLLDALTELVDCGKCFKRIGTDHRFCGFCGFKNDGFKPDHPESIFNESFPCEEAHQEALDDLAKGVDYGGMMYCTTCGMKIE